MSLLNKLISSPVDSPSHLKLRNETPLAPPFQTSSYAWNDYLFILPSSSTVMPLGRVNSPS